MVSTRADGADASGGRRIYRRARRVDAIGVGACVRSRAGESVEGGLRRFESIDDGVGGEFALDVVAETAGTVEVDAAGGEFEADSEP